MIFFINNKWFFSWEEWLAWLASSLSPTEWRLFWESYVSLFGVQSLPLHLNIFNAPQSPTPLQQATGAYCESRNGIFILGMSKNRTYASLHSFLNGPIVSVRLRERERGKMTREALIYHKLCVREGRHVTINRTVN